MNGPVADHLVEVQWSFGAGWVSLLPFPVQEASAVRLSKIILREADGDVTVRLVRTSAHMISDSHRLQLKKRSKRPYVTPF